MDKIKYYILTTIDQSMRAFMLPFADRLDKNRFDISLLCTMTSDFYESNSNEYRCIALDLERGFHLNKTIKCIVFLARQFAKEKPQIIEYGTENVAMCAAIAGFLTRVPIRVYDHWGARYVGFTGFSRFVSKMIEKIAALFSTDIRQVSRMNMEMCIADHIYPKKKVKVVGGGGTVGVDCGIFDINKKHSWRTEIRKEFDIPEDSFLFGFVGRFQIDKGANELLSAFLKLAETGSKIQLMIVGPIEDDGSINSELYRRAEKSNQIIFTGSVRDVYRYISAFDVMVHPTYREGFGMVIQEAGALKTPVITTNIMGPSEIITDGINGLLVEVKNQAELYSAMLQMKEDTELRERLSEKLFSDVLQKFERTVMVNRILDDRKNLLKERLDIIC